MKLGIGFAYTDLDILKNLAGTLSECHSVLIQISTDVLSVLIWFQTFCKDYQQTTTDNKRFLEKYNPNITRYVNVMFPLLSSCLKIEVLTVLCKTSAIDIH